VQCAAPDINIQIQAVAEGLVRVGTDIRVAVAQEVRAVVWLTGRLLVRSPGSA